MVASSQSTGSRVDLARSTACFCLSVFSLLVSHVCQRPIKRRPTALFSSHSFEPFRSHCLTRFHSLSGAPWNLRSAFRKAEAGTLLGFYLQSTEIRDITGAIVNNKLKAGQELGRHTLVVAGWKFLYERFSPRITCFREREQRRPPPTYSRHTNRSTMQKSLLLTLLASSTSVTLAQNCISLSGSKTCPAFNASSISTDSYLVGL